MLFLAYIPSFGGGKNLKYAYEINLLLGKDFPAATNTHNNRRIVACVVFHAVHVVSKESRLLVCEACYFESCGRVPSSHILHSSSAYVFAPKMEAADHSETFLTMYHTKWLYILEGGVDGREASFPLRWDCGPPTQGRWRKGHTKSPCLEVSHPSQMQDCPPITGESQ
jgi:hypothetical protein